MIIPTKLAILGYFGGGIPIFRYTHARAANNWQCQNGIASAFPIEKNIFPPGNETQGHAAQ